MFRRIFLNLIRRPFWTIQRVLLFAVLFGFFAMTFFMDDITSFVSREYLAGVDMNVSVGSYLQQGTYKASYNGSFKDYRNLVNEYIGIYDKLKQCPGVSYAGMDVQTNYQDAFYIKEKDRMGLAVIVDSVRYLESFITYARESNYFGMSITVYGSSDNFYHRFETVEEDVPMENYMPTLPVAEQSDVQFISCNDYYCFIYGTGDTVPQRMRFGTEKLTDGRAFTREEIENGSMVCYIPERYVWFDKSLADDGYKLYKAGDELNLAAYLFDYDGNLIDELDYTFTIIGTYKIADHGDLAHIYIPQKTLLRMHDEAYNYYAANGRHYFDLSKATNIYSPTVMTFTLNSLDDLNSFIETIESLPQYQSGELMYYAAVSDVADVYSGLISFANSLGSIMYIFAVLVVIIAAMMAVLDAFYRRREIALLQSLGESASSVTLQLLFENLILMGVSNAVAIPLALIISKSVIPRLISYIPSIGNTAGQMPGVEYAKVPEIDISAITDSITVSTQQVLLSIVLIVIALAACAAAASLFAKRFSSRRLLNDR